MADFQLNHRTSKIRSALAAVALLGVLALVSCGQQPSAEVSTKSVAAPVSEAVSNDGFADAAAAAAPIAGRAAPEAPPADKPSSPSAIGMFLAFEHFYNFETPVDQVEPLAKKHEAACRAAGPDKCIVLAADVNRFGDDNVQAHLGLRAEPNWLKGFTTSFDADAKSAKGKVKGVRVTSEDLTRQIVDGEAYLRAQTTLAKRLEQLLASRPGKLADLLDIERELARVRGEIDQTTSNLTVMRQRVNMSVLDLTYETKAETFRESAFSPITSAGTDFGYMISQSLGFIIRALAFLLPFAFVILLAAWVFKLFVPSFRWRSLVDSGEKPKSTTDPNA